MIVLGLGSNLGNRKEYLEKSISLLSQKCAILKKSSIHETEPMYLEDQPKFLNQVISIETQLTPRQLLAFCQEIEDNLDRIRTIPNGPRTIDIDILLYNNQTINTKELIIPHPRMQERDFVMKPLSELQK